MKHILLLILICCSIIAVNIAGFAKQSFAGNIDPDGDNSLYAFGENIGWVNFDPSIGPGVTVTDSAVTGLAWGENAGWIKLDPTNGGVTNDGSGNLSGYAWGENIGWISFSCENTISCATVDYGVTIDPATGVFEGDAWAENVGWIRFKSTGAATFGVKTSWGGGQSSDTDGDGLTDALESGYCTDSNDADTDDDGILDGVEDANQNGLVDAGETDPCDIDSENDGLQDGTELGYSLADIGTDTDTGVFLPDLDPTSTTSAIDNDSDNDGLLDGQEDTNYNGRVDSGEHDPNVKAPTYGASGKWKFVAYNAWTDCPESIPDSWTGMFTFTQTGNSISGTDSYGVTHSGTVILDTYTITTDYPESGGTTTETHTLTLESNTSGTGTSSWDWTDGVFSCSGGHEVLFTKQNNAMPWIPLLLLND